MGHEAQQNKQKIQKHTHIHIQHKDLFIDKSGHLKSGGNGFIKK